MGKMKTRSYYQHTASSIGPSLLELPEKRKTKSYCQHSALNTYPSTTEYEEYYDVKNIGALSPVFKLPASVLEKELAELLSEKKIERIYAVNIYTERLEQLMTYATEGKAAFVVKFRYHEGKIIRMTPDGRWSQSRGPMPVGSSNVMFYHLFQFQFKGKSKSADLKMFQYSFHGGDEDHVLCFIRGLVPEFVNRVNSDHSHSEFKWGQEDGDDNVVAREGKAPVAISDAEEAAAATEGEAYHELLKEIERQRVVPLELLKRIHGADCHRAVLLLGQKYNELLEKYDGSEKKSNEILVENNKLIEKYCCLSKNYSAVCAENKILNNNLIELKGNIRVMCRPKPLSQKDKASGSVSIIEVDPARRNRLQLKINDTETRVFKFDHFFLPHENQADVFDEISPMVKSVMDGSNACIFAYGQSGSGKTFTMAGTRGNQGINFRAMEKLFEIAERSLQPCEFLLSIVETSKDGLKDLLSLNSSEKLKIREIKPGTNVIDGLTNSPIHSMEDVSSKMTYALGKRSIGSTNINKESSRSHCVVKVTVRRATVENYLTLVDLAGNESQKKSLVEGEMKNQAGFILKTLGALKNVLSALMKKSSHIPFRDSDLTRILQPCLSKDSKVIMLVCVSSNSHDFSETRESLEFSEKVRGIERATVCRNEYSHLQSPLPQRTGNKEAKSAGGNKEAKSAANPLRSRTQNKLVYSPYKNCRPPRPPDVNRELDVTSTRARQPPQRKPLLPLAADANMAIQHLRCGIFGSSALHPLRGLASQELGLRPLSLAAGDAEAELRGAREDIKQLLKTTSCHPILVRLGWHDAGTYDGSISEWPMCGGANGSLRFEIELKHGANAGLVNALKLIQPIKDKFPGVTYADLFQLASATAIEEAGGPKIPMLYGRVDVTSPEQCPPEGRLPAAGPPSPAEHLREVFYRMCMNDKEIVALSGAHTLGRARPERSGWGKPETKYTKNGPGATGGQSWTSQWLKFDNSYFKVVKERRDKDLLVLPTDAVLFEDAKFKVYAEKYAKDQDAFFEDYAAAHAKLSNLGAKFAQDITLE